MKTILLSVVLVVFTTLSTGCGCNTCGGSVYSVYDNLGSCCGDYTW